MGPVAILVAIGVSSDGYHEILGVAEGVERGRAGGSQLGDAPPPVSPRGSQPARAGQLRSSYGHAPHRMKHRGMGWTRKGAANIMRVRLEMVVPRTS